MVLCEVHDCAQDTLHVFGMLYADFWSGPDACGRICNGAGYAGQNKSAIISIGLTIHRAPVELREKLAVPEAEWPRAIEELCSYPHIEEAAVLSTCNRMELYIVAVSWHRGVREVREEAATFCIHVP